MRDVNRISKVLESLEKNWNYVPDWRFGQLIDNFFSWCISTHRCSEVFFPEDDKWEIWLKDYFEYLTGGRQ